MPFSVALLRPTFASSVYVDPAYGGACSPSKAVDGNRKVWAVSPGNSCFISLPENNPWWAVDIGAPSPIAAVVLLARGDCCGNV